MEQNKLVVQISEKDLLCINGCGFYGNPQWKGYCSICWRNYQRQHNQNAPKSVAGFFGIPENDDSSSTTASASAASTATINPNNRSWSSGLGFDKFLDKRNQQAKPKSTTFRSFLRKSPSTDNTTSAVGSFLPFSSTSDSTASLSSLSSSAAGSSRSIVGGASRPNLKRQLSNESQTAKANFLTFLHKLPKNVAHEVSKQTSLVVEKIMQQRERDHLPVDELSELVQLTYSNIQDRLRRMPAMKDDSEISYAEILEEVEAYICTRCYNVLFCPITDEEVEDLSLQDRIRSLHWVTYGFLQTSLDFSNTVVKDRIDTAITEINDINSSETTCNSPSRRHPQRKLDSILQCSKLIFEALKESRGAPASADEFLPALIYVILRSNPPQLKSNTTFIRRFAQEHKLISGEAGYYFTNLCCALQFVQNLNADSLTMPREEFEAYTSGQMMPPVQLDSSNNRCSQAVKNLESSLEQFRELNIRQERLSNRMDEFERQENEGWDRLFDSMRQFREEHPPGKTLDVAWLESSPDKEELLPPPLQPTLVVGKNEEEGGE